MCGIIGMRGREKFSVKNDLIRSLQGTANGLIINTIPGVIVQCFYGRVEIPNHPPVIGHGIEDFECYVLRIY